MKITPTLFDRGAIGVSVLCMVHCLAMPVLAILFPLGLFAVLAENHWHWLFLALAAPFSLLALYRTSPTARDMLFVGGVCLGILFLSAGVIVDVHRWQIVLTLLGAVSLLAAHVHNLQRLRRRTAA